ncbi:MAG: cytochrome P450 [Solirubrobacteraceae bacterium]
MSNRILKHQLPPGPSLPAPLQILATWKRPAGSLLKLRRRYGKQITVRLPFQPPFVILSDPSEIKELFIAPPDVVHPGEGARILEPIVGQNSVILLDETSHLEHRKLMLPAFHGERMQRLTGLMTELAESEIATWPRDQPVSLHPHLQRLTLEIVLRAVFGLEHGRALDDLREALTKVLVFSESPLSVLPIAQRLDRYIPSLRRFKAIMRRTDAMIFEQIEARRGAANGEVRDDVLSMLLATPMSHQELRDELMTALVAGHETTASQLAWALERLAREPRVSARLTQEVDAGESDEYLTATINEILRLRPVLPNAEPRLTKRPVRIGGREYPPGVLLLASAYLVHHDPEIYPDPFAFVPERFLGPGNAPGTYTWIPFGGGRRRCLGASFAMQEMKIALRVLLSRCRVAPAGATPERTRRRSITFSPDRGARVVLVDRSPRPSSGMEGEEPPQPARLTIA